MLKFYGNPEACNFDHLEMCSSTWCHSHMSQIFKSLMDFFSHGDLCWKYDLWIVLKNLSLANLTKSLPCTSARGTDRSWDLRFYPNWNFQSNLYMILDSTFHYCTCLLNLHPAKHLPAWFLPRTTFLGLSDGLMVGARHITFHKAWSRTSSEISPQNDLEALAKLATWALKIC